MDQDSCPLPSFDYSGFPDPAIDSPLAPETTEQHAIVAGGCFWCTEAVFKRLMGVEAVVSGYAGGAESTANYRAVCSGWTGHAEAIRVTYNAAQITFGQILKVFFSVAHDPTQLNRQGPDYGHQYRSAIFFDGEDQHKIADSYIRQLNESQVFSSPIVTEVVPLERFYPAENYHQDYVEHNPMNPYILMNAVPKIVKLKKLYPKALRGL